MQKSIRENPLTSFKKLLLSLKFNSFLNISLSKNQSFRVLSMKSVVRCLLGLCSVPKETDDVTIRLPTDSQPVQAQSNKVITLKTTSQSSILTKPSLDELNLKSPQSKDFTKESTGIKSSVNKINEEFSFKKEGGTLAYLDGEECERNITGRFGKDKKDDLLYGAKLLNAASLESLDMREIFN